MAYTEIVITRFGDHLVSMLLKDGHPVEFQCVSEKNKVDIGNNLHRSRKKCCQEYQWGFC